MSPKHYKNVPQLVEKYRRKYPELDRDLLRKLIRLENKIDHPSELKKLDRYLKKAFENKNNCLKKVEFGPETTNAIYYYRILQEQYGCKAAGQIADLIESHGKRIK